MLLLVCKLYTVAILQIVTARGRKVLQLWNSIIVRWETFVFPWLYDIALCGHINYFTKTFAVADQYAKIVKFFTSKDLQYTVCEKLNGFLHCTVLTNDYYQMVPLI